MEDKQKQETAYSFRGKTSRKNPIEVKSGTSIKSTSFKHFCEKYKPEKAIRTSLNDYKQEEWMLNIPLYAINSIA